MVVPEISIIVPVYNVEKYLDKCVNSILNQTFQDFELILVDDGSPDNCGQMCDDYAEIDQRVIVIHQKNGGLSAARNAGIEIAKGRYLGFVDSDDYIAEDMYELLYTNLKNEKADLATVGFLDIYAGKEPVVKERKYLVTDMVGAAKIMFEGKLSTISATNKLYKREIFKHIRYPVGMITEDAAVILDVLEETSKVVIDTSQKYYYYHRENSISSNHFTMKDLDMIKAWEENESRVLEKYPELVNVAHTRVCWAYFTVLDKMMNSGELGIEEKKTQKEIIQFLRKNFMFVLKNHYFTKPRKLSMIALRIHPYFYKLMSRLENGMVRRINK
nr:glycosyltransferase family 2 protein [Enterococcus plantarum]